MKLLKFEFPNQVHYIDPAQIARIKLEKPITSDEDPFWVLDIWGAHIVHFSLWYKTEAEACNVMNEVLQAMQAEILN